MIEIVNFRQGAILNSNHGKETKDALEITVQGISESGLPVFINDIPAEMDGRSDSRQNLFASGFRRIFLQSPMGQKHKYFSPCA